MEWLQNFPFSTDGWPEWLAAIAPQAWIAGLLLTAAVVAYIVSTMVKRMVRWLGRRRYKADDEFSGTGWDLAAPVLQLLVFLLIIFVFIEMLGLKQGNKIISLWPRVVTSLVILGGGVFIANWMMDSIRSFGRKAHSKGRVDDTLFNFVGSMVKYLVLAIAIIMMLIQFGVAPGSLIAVVGAAGLAVALALQDTLKAVAAGVMMAVFRPFRIGDFVTVQGLDGEVAEITPFNTTIRQVDNKIVSLTNDKVWGQAIVNHTREPRRRYDLYFGVHYDTDLDQALEILRDVADKHAQIYSSEDIWVGVHELGDWAIKLRLRAWVPTGKFVDVRSDITKSVKQAFDAAGIEIPYPHQVEIQREGEPLGGRRVTDTAEKLTTPETPDEGAPDA